MVLCVPASAAAWFSDGESMTVQARQASHLSPEPEQTQGVWSDLVEMQGTAQQFWEQFLQTLGQQLGARRVLLLVSAVGQPWRALAQWPANAPEHDSDANALLQLLDSTQPDHPVLSPINEHDQALSIRLPGAPVAPQQVVAVVAWHAQTFGMDPNALRVWAQSVAQVPARYAAREHTIVQPSVQMAPAASDPALVAQPHAERLYQILQLSIQLSQQTRFLQMAYELCNALAVRFELDRVSLGWMHPPYVRLTAISHIEKFDAQSTLTRALEGAMEEAADQSGELVYPAVPGSRQVYRAHQSYALMQGVASVVSVPLREGSQVKAVLTLEKREGYWTDEELWELRLMGQAAVRPLVQLQQADRWWGLRARDQLRRWWSQALKPQHSAWKLTGVLSAVLLSVLVLLPWAFRVDATLTLRSKDLLFMPAPFDGYLQQVHVDVGDQVEAGQVLVQLDTRDLFLEESMAQADVMRFSREAQKSQAARQLAEMQINLARQEQSASRLALVRHQLAHAKVTAPQAGVVVEGELKKNLGAPLRKGDLLLKLAQTDDTYLELEIDQVDIHEVQVGTRGEMALVGRPDQRFDIVLERIDPVSTLREGRSVYLARAQAVSAIPAWWRPGMGGSARLDVGERPLIWVMTYRTVRFLREFFWL